MLAPVGGVSSTPPVAPFNTGTPVANVDAQQLQLERQLQTYNQQLAVAQEAARRADQIQRQIAAVQQQIQQRQLDARADELQADDQQAQNLQAQNLQAENLEDDRFAEQLRTDNLLADQQAADLQAADLQADRLAAERLADERLAADQLAADQLADAQNNPLQNATEPQLRPPTFDATELNTAPGAPETDSPPANETLIPPLAPDDSGRLVNTLV